jgi:hypothetical protein
VQALSGSLQGSQLGLIGTTILVDASRDRFVEDLRNLLLVQLKSNRLLFVTDDERLTKAMEDGLSALSHVEFFSPEDLPYHTTRIASGRTVILVALEEAFERVEARGIVDGGIAKLLAGRLWRKLVLVRKSEAVRASTRVIPQPQLLIAELASAIHVEGLSNPATWLAELYCLCSIGGT